MTTFAQALHRDSASQLTAAESGNPGDGTTKWFFWNRIANGGHTTFGSLADALDASPAATTKTFMSLFKGLMSLVAAVSGKVGALSNARTTALATSLVVKATAGTLFGCQGYASAAGYILIHDAASLPADATVPKEVVPVAAGSPFSFDFGTYGVAFPTGIVVVFSTTGPTKTLGAASMWCSAQYT